MVAELKPHVSLIINQYCNINISLLSSLCEILSSSLSPPRVSSFFFNVHIW